MSLNFFEKLSQNLIELLNNGDDYNVIIEVENKKKSFTAHSNVLKFRSSYFRRELENTQPNENNIKIIIKSSISAQIFNVILQYIYGGTVGLENCETRFIYDLMLVADEFEFEELTNKLETLLIETKGSWLRTHFSFIYHSIFSRNNFEKLKNFCNDIIVKYPNLIFDANDFTSLKESALISLIKRNDFQIEENCSNVYSSTNLDDWTKENFLTQKTTLQQCLPHIRYFHISGIEVLNKIEPYKKILNKQFWKDINQHLIAPERPVKSTILPPRSVLVTELPPRSKESFSIIISEEHAAEISTWIDRKTTVYTLTNIPYKFELILRGTQDGFAPQTFWNICHGYARTVVLVKVKGTDEIVGGYNPLAWNNTKNLQYAIVNISKNSQIRWGPHFGDFWMESEKSNFTLDDYCCCSNHGIYYKKPIRSSSLEHFSIINYEELTNKLEILLIETKEFCNDIVVKYPNLIFDADAKWKKIWDYVIKWEIAHTSTFPINLDDWTKENFLILNIEVIDKIEPYRKILDKQLWKDINQHLLILELPELTNKLEILLIETKEFCNDIVVKYPNLIFDADAKWKKIWDYVIKWEIAHTSTFPINLDDWTKENFLILNIEVIDKIEPYRKILDKQLWKDINQHLLILELPVKSIILLPRSVLVTELPPRTQDGFAPQSFLNICHGHACTVVMAKVKRTDEIIGGYNPLAWDKNTGGE
ncbi:hypothetical protein Glove_213g61 [Diversispora epigaea]|uniref:BTB domain-containing protein n=1 Tax=Diversispora epigaea TaxID=1348612 RepID=A0A397IR69_9GLOM|nr:hypothetical protein Glove_213g61 [Diversispora epigaea]